MITSHHKSKNIYYNLTSPTRPHNSQVKHITPPAQVDHTNHNIVQAIRYIKQRELGKRTNKSIITTLIHR